MSNLGLSQKNQIESDYLRLDINHLRRITPARQAYGKTRYIFKTKLIPEGYECGYYNPEDTSDVLTVATGTTEQEALALTLAYLEMMRQEGTL